MWNILDIMRDSLYICTLFLRILAYIQQWQEIVRNPNVSPWGWGRGGPMFFGGRMCFVFYLFVFVSLCLLCFIFGTMFFVIDFYSVLFRKGKEGNDFH